MNITHLRFKNHNSNNSGFEFKFFVFFSYRATITEEQFLKDDFVTKFWPKPTSNIGVWTTIPKCQGPITFSSVLIYASQVGDAAKSGYEVVFRQPRMHELVSDTPVRQN